MSDVETHNQIKEWWERKKLEIDENLDVLIAKDGPDTKTFEIMKKLLTDCTHLKNKEMDIIN
jgi:hypothetical protein